MGNQNLKFFIFAIVLIFCGCANMGQGPTGGKKDIISPTAKTFSPKDKATNVTQPTVEIIFDEYIQVNNANQNIIISPPQKAQPITKGVGKKVMVEFRDSLKPNTTYTIDFGKSIGDYTENNLVKDFTYSFSTGEEVDSLKISGIVLNAEDLTPCEEIYVGIHSICDDSTFTNRAFERIAKTDKEGKFTILGAGNKQYKIFALNDLNNNYYYDQPGETIAFEEIETPIPSIETTIQSDTTYKDSVTIDTIIHKTIYHYKPEDILLRAFVLPMPLQEFNKLKRERNYFILNFTKIEKSLPEITLLDTDKKDWFIVEPSITTDTVKYWITDSTIFAIDSLQLTAKYLVTDSVGKLISRTDTLWVNLNSKQIAEEKKRNETREKLIERMSRRGRKVKRDNVLKLSHEPSTIEIYNPIFIEWEHPLSKFDEDKIHFYLKEDSIYTPIKGKIQKEADPLYPRRYNLIGDFKPEIFYEVRVDSAAAFDFYGNHNNAIKMLFRIKPEEDYATMNFKIINITGEAFVDMLNTKDQVISREKVINNEVKFIHITPGEYYFRLIEDKNGNEKWDTGNYQEQLQPEKVYYFNKKIKFRKNWDVEEEWDIKEYPIHEQRPSGLSSSKTRKAL